MNVHVQKQINKIINVLTERREQLGMSDYHIAARSGVSQPTVHRILSGKNPQASFANILAIAQAMALDLEVATLMDTGKFREWQAERKAGRLMDMTQATSALEGQGVDRETRKEMKARLKQKLLAGPAKNLWVE